MIPETSSLFSVIIPTFNRKSFLEIALVSVLDQACKDFEVIIIDDGSTDGTEKIMSRYQDSRIKYFYQDNRGPAHARNQGIKQAVGDYVAFLDSDDRWVPEKLQKTSAYIKEYPDIKIFHTEELWYRGMKLLNQKKEHKKPTGSVYKNALALCCISISTAVIKRDVFKEVGAFDENFPICEDYDFWLRAAHRYDVKLIPEYLTIKDGGRPDQLTSNAWGLDRYRITALSKMLDSGDLGREEYKMTFCELQKKCDVYIKGAEKRKKIKEVNFYKNLVREHDQNVRSIDIFV